MSTKQKLFYFITGSIICILVLLIFLSAQKQRSVTTVNDIIPTPYQPAQTRPQVAYAPGSIQKTTDKITHPTPLVESDQAIKYKFIKQVGNKSGEIYKTAQFRLTYMQVFNMFEVEILTPNISNAKTEAITWLKQQGLSQDGICNLPLSFFLNNDIKNQLQNQDIIFNPNPEGC